MRGPLSLALVLCCTVSSGLGCRPPEATEHDTSAPLQTADSGSVDQRPTVPEAIPWDASAPPEEATRPNRSKPGTVAIQGEIVPPQRVSAPALNLGDSNCRVPPVVVVRTVVSLEGRLEDVELLKGPSCLEPALRRGLDAWRFEPARLHGEPVRVFYHLTVTPHPR